MTTIRTLIERIEKLAESKSTIVLKNNETGKSIEVESDVILDKQQVRKIKKALGVTNDNKEDIGVRGPQDYIYLGFYSRGAVIIVTKPNKEKDDMRAW
jgi:hypothetical protein